MQAEYLNSINNLVDVLEHIADHRQDMHNKCIDVHNLRGSVNAWNHFFLVWDAKKKVEEMTSVIEKQAFQIEALKRLYKAK